MPIGLADQLDDLVENAAMDGDGHCPDPVRPDHRDHVDGSQDPPVSRVDSPSMVGAGMIGTRGWLA